MDWVYVELREVYQSWMIIIKHSFLFVLCGQLLLFTGVWSIVVGPTPDGVVTITVNLVQCWLPVQFVHLLILWNIVTMKEEDSVNAVYDYQLYEWSMNAKLSANKVKRNFQTSCRIPSTYIDFKLAKYYVSWQLLTCSNMSQVDPRWGIWLQLKTNR